MQFDINHIENQLQNRWKYPYKWGQKQNDQWDRYTNFIYKTPLWLDLVELMKLTVDTLEIDKEALFYYASNRWYNFWSAWAIEKIFTQTDGVIPALNNKDRLVDFSCFGIDFDHKTTVFPKSYDQTLIYAQNHKKELIRWLYDNQSAQQRQHFKNRLFIVVFAEDGQHWKLKAELHWLKGLIQTYVKSFDPTQLESFQFEENNTTLADVIWALK